MALFPSEIRSTKHEIRNNFKTEKRKTRNGGAAEGDGPPFLSLLPWSFEFVSGFVLRISCFPRRWDVPRPRVGPDRVLQLVDDAGPAVVVAPRLGPVAAMDRPMSPAAVTTTAGDHFANHPQ